jgi:hypothetical protein
MGVIMPSQFGYNSMRWIMQDWRYIKEKRRGANGRRMFDTSLKCGGVTRDGKVRLCRPRAVIKELKRTKAGRQALSEQVRAKLKAGKGVRVPYNQMVGDAMRQFQKADTFKDRRK